EESDVSCPDAAAAQAMRRAIDRAGAAGDTLGGVFEVRAFGVPPGLGSHVAADRRLDARLASALMSIPAIKGVEIGMGFAVAGLPGSRVHDPIAVGDGAWPFVRPTNNAGGVEGGTSNGEPIIVRAAMKPIPTLTRPLGSVDTDTMTAAPAHAERSDVCAVPAAAVVGEAEVCVELARALLDMFGSSHVDDLRRSLDGYRQDRRQFWLREDAG
nr:chorismate synthase [Armatimonadota bacterium]